MGPRLAEDGTAGCTAESRRAGLQSAEAPAGAKGTAPRTQVEDGGSNDHFRVRMPASHPTFPLSRPARINLGPLLLATAAMGFVAPIRSQGQVPTVPPPAAQNPSPMVERTRAHTRLPQQDAPGTRRTFTGPLERPVQVFVPSGTRTRTPRLVIHFHGAAFVAETAVSRMGSSYVGATVNLAPGSGVYDRTFSNAAVYDTLLEGIAREVAVAVGRPVTFSRVTLVGFSAGHGAIRAILRDSSHFASVGGVLLLDGMHTSYVPEGTVVEKGGTLDERNLEAFVRFAQAAMRGEKRFVVTHSEIFPGTFASTTETSDHLLQALGLRRTPVLEWGPGGMQQLSEVRRGRLEILGFAGNSAPDHIDHLHGMPEFLRRVER